jgi:hypothetical protein
VQMAFGRMFAARKDILVNRLQTAMVTIGGAMHHSGKDRRPRNVAIVEPSTLDSIQDPQLAYRCDSNDRSVVRGFPVQVAAQGNAWLLRSMPVVIS